MAHNVEELFLAAFLDQANIELDKCYHPKKEDPHDHLETGDNVLAIAETGVFLA